MNFKEKKIKNQKKEERNVTSMCTETLALEQTLIAIKCYLSCGHGGEPSHPLHKNDCDAHLPTSVSLLPAPKVTRGFSLYREGRKDVWKESLQLLTPI